MKVWIEKPYIKYTCTEVHWKEPEWDEVKLRWIDKYSPSELMDGEARDIFCLDELPDTYKHELFEIDLSGKPKVVEVWVPA